MDKIYSIEQYVMLLTTAKTNCENHYFTNNYVNILNVSKWIKEGRLLFQKLDSGVAFFTDFGTKYNLRLCCMPSAKIQIEEMDKPIICELVFNNSITEAQQAVEKELKEDGFALDQIICEYHVRRPTSEKMEEIESLLTHLYDKKYRFEPIQKDDILRAYQLLSESIHRNDLIACRFIDWDRIVRQKLAAVGFSPEGEMCAVCVLPEAYPGGLTAVSNEQRGKGLGKAIAAYSYFYMASDKKKLSLWISVDNHVNKHVMTWMGAIEANRTAHQFARR